MALIDPRTKYQSEFPSEPRQDNPGLDVKMATAPDLGQDSYVGSGKLEGRRALITGGDSGIGAATAIAFAREGADVAISYLPEEQEDAERIVQLIEDAGRKAVAIPESLAAEAKDAREALVELILGQSHSRPGADLGEMGAIMQRLTDAHQQRMARLGLSA